MYKARNNRIIPKVVIERLPRYYRYFQILEGKVDKISSQKLGEIMGSSASQVRLDLSYFGEFGLQGYGYNIKKLKEELANILDIHKERRFIIVGVGNIGRALTRYDAFEGAGFKLMGLFDIKEELIGQSINNVKIYHVSEMGNFIKENKIDIGIISVPRDAANEVAKIMIKSGIKGILNFAPTELDVPEDFPIENIHIIDKALALSFLIKAKEKTK